MSSLVRRDANRCQIAGREMEIDRQTLALVKKRWLRHEEGGKEMREIGEVNKSTRMQIKKEQVEKAKKKTRKEMHTIRKNKRGRK